MVSLDKYLEKLTRKQLEVAVGVLALDKGVDLVTGGRLNKLSKKILVATAKRVLPFAGRAGVSVAGTALGATRLLMANPYILGGTAIYVGYQERDKIRSLLEQGYEIIEERLPTPAPPSLPSLPDVTERPTLPGFAGPITVGGGIAAKLPRPPMRGGQFGEGTLASIGLPPLPRRRKKPSAFNKAVSKGMSTIKKSTSYGKRGIIKPAKKAFALVTKLASAKKKKKKAPKSGIRRKVWNAMGRLR